MFRESPRAASRREMAHYPLLGYQPLTPAPFSRRVKIEVRDEPVCYLSHCGGYTKHVAVAKASTLRTL